MPHNLGIMGGTFDPIHNGHLACAQAAQSACNLDKVLFVVAGNPHFKQGKKILPAELRLKLVEDALQDIPSFLASSVEIERAGVTYTVDTLEQLHREFSFDHLFFIVGSDALATLPSWKDAHRIAELCSIVCVTRPDYQITDKVIETLSAHGITVTMVQADTPQISSSEIRELASSGEDVSHLVPPRVSERISKEGLYRIDCDA